MDPSISIVDIPFTKNHATISQPGSQAFTKRHVYKISYHQFSPRAERERKREGERRGKH